MKVLIVMVGLSCVAFLVWMVWMVIKTWLADRRRPAERARAEAAFRAELEETKRLFSDHERRRRGSPTRSLN